MGGCGEINMLLTCYCPATSAIAPGHQSPTTSPLISHLCHLLSPDPICYPHPVTISISLSFISHCIFDMHDITCMGLLYVNLIWVKQTLEPCITVS